MALYFHADIISLSSCDIWFSWTHSVTKNTTIRYQETQMGCRKKSRGSYKIKMQGKDSMTKTRQLKILYQSALLQLWGNAIQICCWDFALYVHVSHNHSILRWRIMHEWVVHSVFVQEEEEDFMRWKEDKKRMNEWWWWEERLLLFLLL